MPSNGLEVGNEETAMCTGGLAGKPPGLLSRAGNWLLGGGDAKLKVARVTNVVLLANALVLLAVVIVLASQPSKSHHVCTSPECLRVAAQVVEWSEVDATACEDPRRYYCGGWLGINRDKVPSRASWSVMQALRTEELRRLSEKIGRISSLLGTETVGWRLKSLYQSCMATDMVEQDGARPLDKLILELGGWHARRDWVAQSWSWRQALEMMHARLGVTPLFAASLTLRKNSTHLHLQPHGLGLPHPALYAYTSESSVVTAYIDLLKDVAKILGVSISGATQFADDVFSFEKRLANLMLEEDDVHMQTWMTLHDLESNTVLLLFQDILSSAFPRLRVGEDTQLLVTSPHYIKYLINVVTGTSPSILNDYFTWTLIRAYLPYLSTDLRGMWREFQKHITGSAQEQQRWEFCADLVQKTVPLAAQTLLEHGESDEHKQAAELVFRSVQQKVVDLVESSNIMDPEMKAVIIEQVKSLNLRIGLSLNERKADFQRRFYRDSFIVQKHNLFQNIRFSLEARVRIMQLALEEQDFFVLNEVYESMTRTEAIYIASINTVVVPTALTSPPFFHHQYPRLVKFGRLGVKMATAIAEGMFSVHRYSATSYPKYAAAAVHCLEKALSSEEAKWQSVRRAVAAYTRLLGVEVALAAANDANDSAAAGEDAAATVPAAAADMPEALFVASYAQTLCFNRTSQQAELDLFELTDERANTLEDFWLHIIGVQQKLGCRNKNQCTVAL